MSRQANARVLSYVTSAVSGRKHYTDQEWLFICIILLGRYPFDDAQIILGSPWPDRAARIFGATASGFLEWLNRPDMHGTIPGWLLTQHGGCVRINPYNLVERT